MLKDKYGIYIFGLNVLAHFLPCIRVGFDSVSGFSKYYKTHNNWKYQWFIIVILKWKLNQSLILMNNLQKNCLEVKPEFWKITKKNYASTLICSCFDSWLPFGPELLLRGPSSDLLNIPNTKSQRFGCNCKSQRFVKELLFNFPHFLLTF